MRAAIRLAGGREVCFVCAIDEDGIVRTARVVARGDVQSVLALPGFAERGEMLVHNHPSGLLEPSGADYEVAARIHDDGVGFGIIDNDARELYVVVEVPRVEPNTLLDPSAIDADLGPDGPIAKLLPKYEDRPAQRELAAKIAQLYNDGGVGLLEAGTGIGKSLGYLIPALRWAAANRERTVVSTNTINLQEQLVGKDLPFLARALDDQPVRFALLKGWRNYLCRMRLEQAVSTGTALFEESLGNELAALAQWAEHTTDGSLSDMAAPPRAELWDEVSAEPDLCNRARCQFYDTCFLFAARRKAAQADVIVVNHHLLMSDVAVRRISQNWEDAAVLPAYSRLVVDEGHHMEDAAAAHLGASVTRRSLQRLFARLDRTGKGILPALMARLAEGKDLLSAASLDLAATKLSPSVAAARDRAGLVFDLLSTLLDESGVPVLRLTDDFAGHRIWRGGLELALSELLAEIELLHEGLRVVRERLEIDEARAEAVAPLLNELKAIARRLQAAGDALRRTLKPSDDAEPAVRWIEVRGKERNLAVTSVPLDLAPVLREDLFRRVKTAVVTSATLAAEQRFEFLGRRLGLDDPELEPTTALYPSPFDFPRHARLAVPTNAPAHVQFVVRVVLDVATASDGGMFVLATSHRDVRLIAAELRARGMERRWPLLVHGDDGRDSLLRRLRDNGSAVLVGTASFWEGVDVPGHALRALIITKLPFKVPNEPVTAAHCESIERRGGDAFREYMLPHASLRLKQGFGRLIRTATDRGVIVLVDPRVISKSYGRTLLDALPPARRLVGAWPTVLEHIQAFYASR
jgi:ATP-dependent DNA helicase DinG